MRTNRLHSRDKNIVFFHRFSSTHKRKNRISKLVKENDCEVHDEQGMREVATNFFSEFVCFKQNRRCGAYSF